MTARRIVLLGAARSGTKLLRDALGAATGSGVVPYDIPFIWRYGNLDAPDDRLEPRTLRPKTRRFITESIDAYARSGIVIEKTVGNTLRVPYVSEVFPEATYLHLIRDGVDVTESTYRQWREPMDSRYVLRKLRHFPLRLAPTYGRRYVTSLIRRRMSSDRRVASWGALYPGIEDDLKNEDVLTVCARQWRDSVTYARRDLAELAVPVVEVRYGALVAEPTTELARVADACGLPFTDDALEAAASVIRDDRCCVGRRALSSEELALLEQELGPLLAELGYQPPTAEQEKTE